MKNKGKITTEKKDFNKEEYAEAMLALWVMVDKFVLDDCVDKQKFTCKEAERKFRDYYKEIERKVWVENTIYGKHRKK